VVPAFSREDCWLSVAMASFWSAMSFALIDNWMLRVLRSMFTTTVVVNIDRKTRNIQLSIKAKDMADQNEAMATLSQQSSRENAGTTSLGALLRAKLDSNN
jgi:hypothetical protein